MSTMEIERRAKYISDKRGKHLEVILPYKLYRELLELKTTMEIYEKEEVQKGIRKSKQQVREGKTKSFKTAEEAIHWLRR